ncbi:retrotransposon protein, putative, ty1-copia subclass [Tanacetum coccineum]
MMNLTTLSLSFWDYALETATRILNMVPTKKVGKTPYELWYEKVPSLSYLKRKIFCLKKSVGGPKNLKKFKIKIHHLSEIPMEVEGFKQPQEEVVPIRRSARAHRAPNRLCLNVEVEEHSLGDPNEPTNYKAAILDSKSDKWLNPMNAEMQSMKDNQVQCLVDLPSNCKTVRSK